MLLRKKRSAKQLDALRYKQTAPIGIGATREEARLLKRQYRRDVIAWNRRVIFQRDKGCRRCKVAGRPDDHCHEVVPRSALRGRPPEEIYNRHNCLRLCADCHELITRHVEDIVYDEPLYGCDRHVEFVPRAA